MKDSRVAEVVWLVVLAVLTAAGASPILQMLSHHKAVGLLLAAAGAVASVMAIRRGYKADPDSMRVEVTKGAAYLVTAGLAGFAIVAGKYYGTATVMGEVAIVFDIVSILARRPRRETASAGNTKST